MQLISDNGSRSHAMPTPCSIKWPLKLDDKKPHFKLIGRRRQISLKSTDVSVLDLFTSCYEILSTASVFSNSTVVSVILCLK